MPGKRTGPTGKIDWQDDYYQSGCMSGITSMDFVNHVFVPTPSLKSRKPIDGGWFSEAQFCGQAYDPAAYDVVPGGWDHDHCGVCFWRIEEGDSYWKNSQGIILCDRCRDCVVEGIP